MANREFYQSPLFAAVVFTVLTVGLFAVPGVPLFLQPPTNHPDAPELRGTGYAVVALWAWGWPIATAKRLTRDQVGTNGGGTRTLYTLGCIGCLFHVVLAFHVGHEWSHENAYEHTKQVSGVGEGIFVNYLFAVVWILDVFWAWVAFDHYLSRPVWISVMVHGFMGFIVFNAAVVFGSGMNRWFSLFWMAIPLGFVIAAWWWDRRNRIRTFPNDSSLDSDSYNDSQSAQSNQLNQ